MSRNPKLPRIALIGISGYGRVHLQLARELRDRGEADIVAATVINARDEQENVAELGSRGCSIYGNHDEMLAAHAAGIDLCLVPTGIHLHAGMTVAALRSGANVLVEKPLSASTAEVEAVKAAERETGRFVAVGFQDFYDASTQWLKDELLRGAIGELRSIRFLGLWPRPRSYFTRNNWAGRLVVDGAPVYDSPLSNAFAHFVMLSLYFAGATRETAAAATIEEAELFRAHDIESFDTAVVKLRTDRGVELWFGASHAGNRNIEPEVIVTGSAGTAGWRYESEAWWDAGGGKRRVQPLLDANWARRAMMAACLRRLRDPSASVCTTGMAGRHTEIVESLHASAEIAAFPAGAVHWSGGPADKTAVPTVDGLEAALRRAYEAQCSLGESDFRAIADARAG